MPDEQDQEPRATPETYAQTFCHFGPGRLVMQDLLRRYAGFGTRPSTTGVDGAVDLARWVERRVVVDFIAMQLNIAEGANEDGHDE